MILLRSAVFNVMFFGISLVMTLLATAVRVVAPGRVLDVAMLWGRCLVVAARVVCGIRLEVRGLEHIPPGAALIASRHQSAFDTFVWLTLLPRCCYVFKQELRRIPLFGKLIGAAGMIEVDRTGGGTAVRALLVEADRGGAGGSADRDFPGGDAQRAWQPGDFAVRDRSDGVPQPVCR